MKIEIIRSDKRRKTVSGRLIDDTLVIRAPVQLSEAELKPIIENLQRRVERRQKRKSLDNAVLMRRADS